jgi:hypothetical protein
MEGVYDNKEKTVGVLRSEQLLNCLRIQRKARENFGR